VKYHEGWTAAADGTRLFWRRYMPDDKPRAELLFVHGLAEHSSRYGHVMRYFADRGFDCWALDYRCHGKSPGLRVHVDRFDEFLLDIAAAYRLVRAEQTWLPLYLVGHSQGGLLALRHVLIHPEGIEGIIVSSPFLGMHPNAAPSAPLHVVANIISTFSPKLMFSKVAEPRFLSRNPSVAEAYVNDPLVSNTVSARWFTEVLRAQADTLARAPDLTVPALVMQSGDDRLADPAATRAWVEAAPADLVDYVEWDGLYHEMFNEPEKQQVFEKMDGWLDGQIRVE
jgi:alpha-beta hydrolase superfamily lysophospholipase